MSFEGMRKSIRMMEAPTPNANASAHLSDEFPGGYSLMGCSPALPTSASPPGVQCASESLQITGMFIMVNLQPDTANSCVKKTGHLHVLRTLCISAPNEQMPRLAKAGYSNGD